MNKNDIMTIIDNAIKKVVELDQERVMVIDYGNVKGYNATTLRNVKLQEEINFIFRGGLLRIISSSVEASASIAYEDIRDIKITKTFTNVNGFIF